MLLNWEVIAYVNESVISGAWSLKDADEWATKVMYASDNDTLRYDPKLDEPSLWETSQFLCGIHMQISHGKYLHSAEQVKQEYERCWERRCA